MAIEKGILVKVEGMVVHVTTMNPAGFYERDKNVPAGRPIFGTVMGIYKESHEVTEPVWEADDRGNLVNVGQRIIQPVKFVALVRWDGPKYRTSILPLEKLQPAINLPDPIVVLPAETPKKAPRRRKTTKKQ